MTPESPRYDAYLKDREGFFDLVVGLIFTEERLGTAAGELSSGSAKHTKMELIRQKKYPEINKDLHKDAP